VFLFCFWVPFGKHSWVVCNKACYDAFDETDGQGAGSSLFLNLLLQNGYLYLFSSLFLSSMLKSDGDVLLHKCASSPEKGLW